jgi:hypothetical protein
LEEARRFKKATWFGFEIKENDTFNLGAGRWNHSGILLAGYALKNGHDIKVIGFDLGGLDIYSLNNQNVRKYMWIMAWRECFEVYDPDRIEFIGYDHKPYILSNKSLNHYAKAYTEDRPHIHQIEYIDIWNHFKKWREVDPRYTGDKLLDRTKIMMEAVMSDEARAENPEVTNPPDDSTGIPPEVVEVSTDEESDSVDTEDSESTVSDAEEPEAGQDPEAKSEPEESMELTNQAGEVIGPDEEVPMSSSDVAKAAKNERLLHGKG